MCDLPTPYLNGPRHTFLNLSIKSINPRLLSRVVDRVTKWTINVRNLEPPFLPLQSAIPNCYAPHVDATKSKIAFGNWALPKLRRELHDPNKLVVRQAVNSIADMVHDPEKTFEAIRLNIISRIQDLLLNDDPFLRERSAAIMATIAGQELGRNAITKRKVVVEHLAFLLRDVVPSVRLHANKSLEMLARFWGSADVLNDIWLVPILVTQLTNETEDEIIVINLQILEYLLDRSAKKVAIQLGTMDILQPFIDNPKTSICSGALACLMQLTMHRDGKKIAIETDLLVKLKEKLNDDRREVHSKAAGAIMFVTHTTPSKFRALELDIIDRLLLLASDFKCQELQINCVKALTNISEAPKGREILLNHQASIESINTGGLENLERHVATLLAVIRWKP